MLKRDLTAFALACALVVGCGTAPAARAQWQQIVGPIGTERLPSPPPQSTLTIAPLTPAAPGALSAPLPVRPDVQGGSQADAPKDTPAPEPVPKKRPAQDAPAREAAQSPGPVEAPAPAPEPSHGKTPWFLVAGGVVVAFFIGRRSR